VASAAKPSPFALIEPSARQERVASDPQVGRSGHSTSASAEREIVKVGSDQGQSETCGDEQHARRIAPVDFFAKFPALRRV
jgi:hypothetical protein